MSSILQTIQERDVRQFYLINDVDELFDLTSFMKDDKSLFEGFLHTPDGLGYQSENVYQEITHYDVMTSKEWVNNDVTGELIFKSYEQYTSFMYFISHTKALYLAYILPYTNGLEGYPTRPRVYAQCDITSLNKSEKDSDNGLLLCNITIHLLEPWKSEKMIKQSTDQSEPTNEKKYNYSYDLENNDSYIYGISTGSYIIVNNIGTATTYPTIRIYGASTQPTIVVKDYNTSDVLQAVAYEDSLVDGDVLELYGDPLGQYIKINGANAYDNINKDLNTFISLPPGKSIVYLESVGGRMEVEYEFKFYSI